MADKSTPPVTPAKTFKCFRCNHEGPTVPEWKGGNYNIWSRVCAACGCGVFVQ